VIVFQVLPNVLEDNNLIKNKTLFKLYVVALGEEGNLKAGSYSLSKSLNIVRIVSILTGDYSDLDEVKVTIPEGYNIWEIDELLTKVGIIKETQFSSRFYKDEGYFFPDTYRFKKLDPKEGYLSLHGKVSSALRKDEEINLIGRRMKQNFEDKTNELFQGQTLDEIRRIIIIASMLEKEVFTYREMRLVAGIIEKRISLDRSLQLDATVSYGACLRDFNNSDLSKNCNVSWVAVRDEIKIDSDYNSYRNKELPIGPISNPGLLAIQAAMNPLKSEYLYYLSPRNSLETIFSITDQEHAEKRKFYLGL